MIKDGNGNICQQLRMPPPMNGTLPPSRDLVGLRLPSVSQLQNQTARSGTLQRSHSPMSIQSSWSTNPRRNPEQPRFTAVPDNDTDSVFSSSSRAVSDADTLKRKRKRSVMTEGTSSGASEENDRNQVAMRDGMRSSLGPQRRRGRNQSRFKTMDGASIKSVMDQFNQVPALPLFTPVPIIQPAKSLNYLNSNTLNPPITPSAKVIKEFPFKDHATPAVRKSESVFEFRPQLQHSGGFSFQFDAPKIGQLGTIPPSISGSNRSIHKAESPKLSLVPQVTTDVDVVPKHSRSLSTSDKSSPVAQPPRRMRIRSDSHFSGTVSSVFEERLHVFCRWFRNESEHTIQKSSLPVFPHEPLSWAS